MPLLTEIPSIAATKNYDLRYQAISNAYRVALRLLQSNLCSVRQFAMSVVVIMHDEHGSLVPSNAYAASTLSARASMCQLLSSFEAARATGAPDQPAAMVPPVTMDSANAEFSDRLTDSPVLPYANRTFFRASMLIAQ